MVINHYYFNHGRHLAVDTARLTPSSDKVQSNTLVLKCWILVANIEELIFMNGNIFFITFVT